jgi:hypothetical protein
MTLSKFVLIWNIRSHCTFLKEKEADVLCDLLLSEHLCGGEPINLES